MQCNYNSFIQILNFHVFFRNALRCRRTGACRIPVLLRYFHNDFSTLKLACKHVQAKASCNNFLGKSYYANVLLLHQ